MTATKPRRVLMTADAVGGVWSYALTLAAALGERAKVLLAVTGPAPSPEQRSAAAAIPGLEMVHAGYRLEWMADAARDLDRNARWLGGIAGAFRPDLVHVNGYAAAAAGWTVPVLVVAHSCVLSWWQAIHRASPPPEWDAYASRVASALACADEVVAPSHAMLRALTRHYGFRGGRVVANGCALERFAPRRKQKFVLAAGRFWDQGKNLAALDRAARRSPWPVGIAGDCRSPEGRQVAPRWARALGALAPKALARLMGRAAIYALPARYEPFGLSVLEAAASGCALVLGDIPSLRELWQDAALFVLPEDSAPLASAITRLAADAEERQRLADAARTRARRFSARTMADAYAALYDEMIGARYVAAPRPLARAG